MDMVMLRYVNMINGLTGIALTKLNILDDPSVIKVGVAYKINGQRTDYIPTVEEELKHVGVEYLEMPGWQTSPKNASSFAELPANAEWIGVGSSRDAVITL